MSHDAQNTVAHRSFFPTIVNNLNQCFSSIFYNPISVAFASTAFSSNFDNRSGSLYNLPSSNLVGNMIEAIE
jgi:hypothetical protein